MIAENFSSALIELKANKFRAFLTTLGIIIAVAAIISVVSIIEGMSRNISGFIQGMGSDAMWISPYMEERAQYKGIIKARLTPTDTENIREHSRNILRAINIAQVQSELVYKGKTVFLPVVGTNTEFQSVRNWFVDVGRFFTESDERLRKDVCVLGREILKKLEEGEDIINNKVTLFGRSFVVIGLLEKKGSFFGRSQDEIVIVPFSVMMKIYGDEIEDRINIMVQMKQDVTPQDVVSEVKSILRKSHKLMPDQPDDFEISTQDQVLDFFRRATQTTTVVLAGIVGISLLVGEIGIMNIMLVSVTERTREIGILNALGARPRDILLQFLIEALTLSLAGGFIGILLGFGVSFGISAVTALPKAVVPLWAILLSVLFSASVGIFFGMYPAIKAARLNPIVALRYE